VIPGAGAGRPAVAHRDAGGSERGSALVEFVGLVAIMILPVFYLVMVAGRVEGAAFAAEGAAEAAGRAYVTAGSDAAGQSRAQLAAELVLAADGLPPSAGRTVIECGACDYAPGSTVTVQVHILVPLPGLPAAFCGSRGCVAAVPVDAVHTEELGCFIAGVAGSGC
jgi:hypothetical protein